MAPDGTVYFSESNTIRRISPQGDVTTWAGNPGYDPGGHRDGPAAQALFNNPTGLILDARGNVYVADMSNYVIRKITPVGLVSTLAGQVREYGGADGVGPAARFDNSSALAVAPDGALLVADNGNSCIRRVGLDGTVTTWVGTPPATPGPVRGRGPN